MNKSISLLLLLPAITFISTSTLADKPLEEDKPVVVEAQESSDSTAESSVSEDSAMSSMAQTMSTVENQEMGSSIKIITNTVRTIVIEVKESKRRPTVSQNPLCCFQKSMRIRTKRTADTSIEP